MIDPFYRGPDTPNRQRRVTELPHREDRVEGVVATEVADQVFNDMSKVANKAKALADAVSPLAAALWIPVNASATEVQAAVKRKDQTTPDGMRITFDLFKDAIETLERRKDAIRLESLEDLTGNDLADDRKIRHLVAQSDHEDLSQDQIVMMMSQLMVLLVLNYMLGPYKATDAQQQVATKIIPPGAEAAPTIIQVIIGIVYQLLVVGLEESLIENYLDQSGVAGSINLPAPEIIARAKSREPDQFQDLATRAMGESDYEIILRYSFDYMARTEKSGYEMWLAYHDARLIRHDAMTQWRSGPMYSPQQAYNAHGLSGNPAHWEENDIALSQIILDSIVPAETEFMCAMRDHVTRLDSALNIITQVVSTHVGQDVLCCVSQFIGHKNLKWIDQARQVIRIFTGMQGQIRQLDFNQLIAGVVAYLDQRVRRELLDLSHRVVHEIADPVLESLEDLENSEWDALYKCPLIHDLVEMLIRSIHMIGDTLASFVAGITIEWDATFGPDMRQRWQVVNTRRKAQILLRALDETLAALQSGLLCANEHGDFPDHDMEDFVGGLPDMPHIKLDPVVLTEYFGGTGPIEVPDGVPGAVKDIIPPLSDAEVHAGAGTGTDAETDAVRHCRELFSAILGEMKEGG